MDLKLQEILNSHVIMFNLAFLREKDANSMRQLKLFHHFFHFLQNVSTLKGKNFVSLGRPIIRMGLVCGNAKTVTNVVSIVKL